MTGLPKYVAVVDLEQACVELASEECGQSAFAPLSGGVIGIQRFRDIMSTVGKIAEKRCREAGHVGDCPRVIDYTVPDEMQTGPGLEKWDV